MDREKTGQAATRMTSQQSKEQQMVTLDAAKLRQDTDRVLKAVTDEAFLQRLVQVHAAPPELRLNVASELFTPEALREAGIYIPEGVRLSSRYFDDKSDSAVELADNEKGVNIVKRLNELQPGFLDKVRNEEPALFDRIVAPKDAPSLRPIAGGGCACVGYIGCVGVGWG